MRKFEKISFERFVKDIKKDKDLYNEYKMPVRQTKKSAGYDFFAIEDISIKPGEIKKIPTGIKAIFEEDETLMIFVRSSMGFKWNVRMCNQVGIIDSDFYNNPENEGHIWFALQNHGDKEFKVKKGESFGQGLFFKYLTVDDEEEIVTDRVGWSGKPDE